MVRKITNAIYDSENRLDLELTLGQKLTDGFVHIPVGCKYCNALLVLEGSQVDPDNELWSRADNGAKGVINCPECHREFEFRLVVA